MEKRLLPSWNPVFGKAWLKQDNNLGIAMIAIIPIQDPTGRFYPAAFNFITSQMRSTVCTIQECKNIFEYVFVVLISDDWQKNVHYTEQTNSLALWYDQLLFCLFTFVMVMIFLYRPNDIKSNNTVYVMKCILVNFCPL